MYTEALFKILVFFLVCAEEREGMEDRKTYKLVHGNTSNLLCVCVSYSELVFQF